MKSIHDFTTAAGLAAHLNAGNTVKISARRTVSRTDCIGDVPQRVITEAQQTCDANPTEAGMILKRGLDAAVAEMCEALIAEWVA